MEKSKNEKLAEFHRSNILQTAKKLINERGVAQTTMEDIAKESGYSKPTLYAYFTNKDEIINHIVYDNMVLLKEAFVDTMDNYDNIVDFFWNLFKTHVFHHNNTPLFFESMIGNVSKKEDMSIPIIQEIYKVVAEIHQAAFKLFEDAIAKKQVREDIDILKTTFALWAAFCGIIIMAYNKESYLKGMNAEREEFLEYGFRTYMNSILNVRE